VDCVICGNAFIPEHGGFRRYTCSKPSCKANLKHVAHGIDEAKDREHASCRRTIDAHRNTIYELRLEIDRLNERISHLTSLMRELL
jgi:hypothetical protein